jgi:hypothetical protein
VLQVIADRVGGYIVLAIPTGIAGGHQDGSAAGIFAGLYIHCSISNHVALAKIETEILRCSLQHTGSGFPVRANHPVLGYIGVLMMRAKIHGIDAGLLVSKQLPQLVMDRIDILFRTQSAGDDRLVGYYDDLQPRVIEQANAFGCARKKAKLVNTVEKVHLFIDDAIAVQEYTPHAFMLP